MIYQPDAVHDQLMQAQATVRSGIQESRRAIRALRATPLEDLGLPEALRQLCSGLAQRLGSQSDQTGLRFNWAIAGVGSLDPLTEQTIYRVAESALNKVEQHASASAIWVSMDAPPDQRMMRLDVRDNGIGFDPAAVPQDRFGLAGMRERAQLLGASLRVESSPGHGTRIVLEVEP
jgi:signal transduction histidine kinase